jgi:hypothetical protein
MTRAIGKIGARGGRIAGTMTPTWLTLGILIDEKIGIMIDVTIGRIIVIIQKTVATTKDGLQGSQNCLSLSN